MFHPQHEGPTASASKSSSSNTSIVTVRRVAVPAELMQVLDGNDLLTPHRQRLQEEVDPSGLLSVRHQITLGASPKVSIEWQADANWLGGGGRVLIFRNRTGFAKTFNAIPVDQIDHGEQMIDSRENDYIECPVEDGATYFTVLLASVAPLSIVSRAAASLRQSLTGSPTRVGAFVRFSVTVPSGKTAVSRINQQAELYESIERNAKARERVGKQLNTNDRHFEADRHAAEVQLETEKRVREFRGIKDVFRKYVNEVRTDTSLNAAEAKTHLRELGALERSMLAAANFPYIDCIEPPQDSTEL